jgi:hypothetical protein
MKDDQFHKFLEYFIGSLQEIDSDDEIVLKITKDDINNIEKDNFKVLALKSLAGLNIGIMISSIGWSIIYGSIYSNILTADHRRYKKTDDSQLRTDAEKVAQTFFDIATGKIPFVLHLSVVTTPPLISNEIQKLPSVAQFFVKNKKTYDLVCVTFPFIEGGWDSDESSPAIRYKDIVTDDLRTVEIPENTGSPRESTINIIKSLSFPIKTNLITPTQPVTSLKEIIPINYRITFRI